jgi:CheY-like chemotaxis protein
VVDDNLDSAETMALLLAEFGHEAQAAHSGAEALRCGDALRPDLVFLDIGMPGMDGYEVCRRLRATDWGSAAKVIALTGWGGEADKAAARAAGFDGHLTKPAAPEALAALAGPAGVHPL